MEFFDALIRSDLSVEAVCDRVAEYLDRPVGCVDRRGNRVSSTGRTINTKRVAHRDLVSGETVWIGGTGSDTDFLLEQFAVVAKVAMARKSRRPLQSASVRVVIGSSSEGERRTALRSLNIRSRLQLLALAGPEDGRAQIVDEVRERVGSAVFTADVGRTTAMLVGTSTPLERLWIPAQNHLGASTIMSALEGPEAWHQAWAALRFSQPSPRAGRDHSVEESVQLNYSVMAPFAPLADVWSGERTAGLPDVRALDILIIHEGPEMLRTLDLVAATDSYREAARQLHTHHSTVAAKVARAERALGFSFNKNYGRPRLMVGLMMRRLRDTSDLM